MLRRPAPLRPSKRCRRGSAGQSAVVGIAAGRSKAAQAQAALTLFILLTTTLVAAGGGGASSAFCGPLAGEGWGDGAVARGRVTGDGRPSVQLPRLRRRRGGERSCSNGKVSPPTTLLFDSLSSARDADSDNDGDDGDGMMASVSGMMLNMTKGVRPTPKQEMSAFFVFVSLGALLLLAMNDPEPGRLSLFDRLGQLESDLTAGYDIRDLGDVLKADGLDILEEEVGELGVVADNIMSVVLPTSAPDLLAAALGEGIAGAIGAASTWGVQTLVRLRNEAQEATAASIEAVKGGTNRRFGGGGGRIGGRIGGEGGRGSGSGSGSGSSTSDDIFTETVADGDYFLTRAAAIPLLEAAGIPQFTASLAAAALATLPYELIKITSRERRRRVKEDELLDQLLREEQARKAQRRNRPFWERDRFGSSSSRAKTKSAESASAGNTADNGGRADESSSSALLSVQIAAESGNTLDVVEFFTDVVKWLEYTVLVQNFSGEFIFTGRTNVDAGIESAIFGGLAALSSQLYADNIYIYTDLGRERASAEARNRDLEGWANLYTIKCLSAATLFGVYASFKVPIGRFVQSLLTGGVDGCLGSDDYDLCAGTYVEFNPPAMSAEAQFRAAADSAVNLADRLLAELLGNPDVDVQEWGRGLLVHFNSVLHFASSQ